MKTNPLNTLIIALAGVFVIFATSVGATITKVYSCEHGELVVFSQTPCEVGAEQVTIKSSQSNPDPQAPDKLKQQTQAVNTYVDTQDKTRQIAIHYRNVERYKRQMRQEFAQMQQTRYRSEADKNKALAALKLKFDGLIGKEHEAIKGLSEQKDN